MKPITPRLLMARINKFLQSKQDYCKPAVLHKSRPNSRQAEYGTYYLEYRTGGCVSRRQPNVDLLALAKELGCIQEWEQLC